MISQDLQETTESQSPIPLLCDFRNRQEAVRRGDMEAVDLWAWCVGLPLSDKARLQTAIEEQEARAAALA